MRKRYKICKTCGAKLAKKNYGGLCMTCWCETRIPWNKGKHGLQEAWNKGIPHKPESIEKMRQNRGDISGNKNPMYGKTHNKAAKERISKATKERQLGSKHSDETKRKMRISAINYLQETNKITPRYNKDACKFFEYINSIFNLKGQHAENGGEHYIKDLGYWLDYIDFKNKLIIENNEKKHYDLGRRNEKTKLKERELKRFYPDFIFIITRIPRAGKYEQERLEELFKTEANRITRARKVVSRGRNKINSN
jgi:hypothetical protein